MTSIQNVLEKARKAESENKFDVALKYYREILKEQIGDNALIHQEMGKALAHLGELDEAIAECNEALKLDPNLSLSHKILGAIYTMQKKYRFAEREFQTSLELKPNDVDTLARLSDIYFFLGEYDKAEATIEKVQPLQSNSYDLKLLLAHRYIYRPHPHQKKAKNLLEDLFKEKPFDTKIYVLYATWLVNFWWKFLQKYNPFVRMVIGFIIANLLLIVALFLPRFISIPVGILMTIYGLLESIIRMNLAIKSGKKSLLVFLALIFPLVICYWISVMFN